MWFPAVLNRWDISWVHVLHTYNPCVVSVGFKKSGHAYPLLIINRRATKNDISPYLVTVAWQAQSRRRARSPRFRELR